MYPPGKHVYNFACALPDRLPGTLCTREVDIEYKVKVVMDIPMAIDTTESQIFCVRNVLDLNLNPSLKMPVQMEHVKSFCLFKCSPQLATAYASVPQGGFARGQVIPISCQINNKTNVVFEDVKVSLVRRVQATSTSPRHNQRESTFTEAEVTMPLVEDTRNRLMDIRGELLVPAECMVSNHFAAYVLVDYHLNLEFRVVGCHSNFDIQLPVEIGSIQLGAPGYGTGTEVPLAPMPAAADQRK